MIFLVERFRQLKHKKRILSFFLSVIMIIGCTAAAPHFTVKADASVVSFSGASISFDTPKKLRLKFSISQDDVSDLKEYGALIAATYDLGGSQLNMSGTGYTYTKAIAFSKQNGVDASYSEQNGAKGYAISINGIDEEDYDKMFSVRPYVISNSGVAMFGNTVSKSVYSVALQAAYDTESDYSSEERGEFLRIVERYATDSSGNPVDLEAGNAKAVEVQAQTNERITEIRSAASDYTAGGNVYYVSENGNDGNNGTSAGTPWRSLDRVNSASLTSGDVVLFKRGDTFRGQLVMSNGVTYSAYGEGEKPKLYGSPANGAVAGKWSKLGGSQHIWVYQDELPDVGLIVFDGGKNLGLKTEPYFVNNEFVDTDNNTFDIVTELDRNYEFFSDCENVLDLNGYPTAGSTGSLYLYCDLGNPGEVFDSIEFCCYGNIITGAATNNVTIDNLCIMYGGSHAIGTSKAVNFTVQNCEIGYIGGSIYKYNTSTGKPARYGNGVQVHGSCDGYTVTNNYIYQVFDAGITHQQGGILSTDAEFKNIIYSDNVIEKCAWSVEYFMNTANAGYTHTMSNIEISRNIMRLAGSGFGQYRDDQWHYPTHIMSWWLDDSTSNAATGSTFIIIDNIFDRSTKSLIEIHAEELSSLPVLSNNTYIQYVNKNLGRYSLYESNYNTNQIVFNNLSYSKFGSTVPDTGAEFFFTDYSDVISDLTISQAAYFNDNPLTQPYGFTVNLSNGKTVRYLKLFENGLRLTDVKIPSLTGNSTGNPVTVIQFSDTHLIGENDEEDAQKVNLVALYEARIKAFSPIRTVRTATNSLNFGKLFDRMIVTGDLFDYYSNGCKALSQEVFNNSYSNLLTLLGNHESSESIGSITGGLEFETLDTKVIYEDLNSSIYGYGAIQTEGAPSTLAEAAEYNDIYLAQNLLCDAKGNEKALLLMMDNSWDLYFRYDENDFHYDLLEFYINYARTKQIPVLIFQHKPISTGWDRDIITTFDIINNPNGANSNFGKNGTGLAGGSYNTDVMTQRVYDLITNSADVIKGVFCGDYHNNIYSEISAKTSNGISTVIPQYTVSGNYNYSNCIRITVE